MRQKIRMDNKVQNKLAKFAGFKEVRFKEPPYEVCWVEDKNGKMFTDGEPDLVNSLDAQATYLYPKFEALGYYPLLHPYCMPERYWVGFGKLEFEEFKAPITQQKYANAFALACEKLIDTLEKKNV